MSVDAEGSHANAIPAGSSPATHALERPGFWVFGYGSLVWNPGFPFLAAHHATLHGHQRRLCVLSVVHRGTYERPGLVFGLDRGGACDGAAFYVHNANHDAVVDYLRARELVTGVYRESWRPISVHGIAGSGGALDTRALCFVVDLAHRQYCTGLTLAEQHRIVVGAVGRAGPNADYVINTSKRLQAMGLRDRPLERLAGALLASPGRAVRLAGQPVPTAKLTARDLREINTTLRKAGRVSPDVLQRRVHPVTSLTPLLNAAGYRARLHL